MNREYKFRALSENIDGTSDWVYGYLSKCCGAYTINDEDGNGIFVNENTSISSFPYQILSIKHNSNNKQTFQSKQLPGTRGTGIVSRIFDTPVHNSMKRSKPKPQPP